MELSLNINFSLSFFYVAGIEQSSDFSIFTLLQWYLKINLYFIYINIWMHIYFFPLHTLSTLTHCISYSGEPWLIKVPVNIYILKSMSTNLLLDYMFNFSSMVNILCSHTAVVTSEFCNISLKKWHNLFVSGNNWAVMRI